VFHWFHLLPIYYRFPSVLRRINHFLINHKTFNISIRVIALRDQVGQQLKDHSSLSRWGGTKQQVAALARFCLSASTRSCVGDTVSSLAVNLSITRLWADPMGPFCHHAAITTAPHKLHPASDLLPVCHNLFCLIAKCPLEVVCGMVKTVMAETRYDSQRPVFTWCSGVTSNVGRYRKNKHYRQTIITCFCISFYIYK
jgi:hypothetical protein